MTDETNPIAWWTTGTDLSAKSEPINSLAELLRQDPYTFKGSWFFNQTFYLDGYGFAECRFEKCRLHIAKGTFILRNCLFTDCTFIYEQEAVKVARLHNSNLPRELQPNNPSLLAEVDGFGRMTIE